MFVLIVEDEAWMEGVEAANPMAKDVEKAGVAGVSGRAEGIWLVVDV